MSYSNHSPCYTLHTVKERSPDHISYSHSPFTMLLITQSITIHHIVHPRVSRSVCYTSNRHQLPQSTSNSHHLPQYISSSHHSPCYALHSDTCIKWIKVKYVQERQYSMDEMKAHERVTMDKVKMCQKNDTVLCKRWRHTKQSPCSEDKSTHHLPLTYGQTVRANMACSFVKTAKRVLGILSARGGAEVGRGGNWGKNWCGKGG